MVDSKYFDIIIYTKTEKIKQGMHKTEKKKKIEESIHKTGNNCPSIHTESERQTDRDGYHRLVDL